jgi:hypothetical protein
LEDGNGRNLELEKGERGEKWREMKKGIKS